MGAIRKVGGENKTSSSTLARSYSGIQYFVSPRIPTEHLSVFFIDSLYTWNDSILIQQNLRPGIHLVALFYAFHNMFSHSVSFPFLSSHIEFVLFLISYFFPPVIRARPVSSKRYLISSSWFSLLLASSQIVFLPLSLSVASSARVSVVLSPPYIIGYGPTFPRAHHRRIDCLFSTSWIDVAIPNGIQSQIK